MEIVYKLYIEESLADAVFSNYYSEKDYYFLTPYSDVEFKSEEEVFKYIKDEGIINSNLTIIKQIKT